jgi:hypothetical protein
MARPIHASNMSLDGSTEDERGALDWAPPDDDVFVFITELHAVRGHVPLRAADVRDDGGLADRLHPRRPIRSHGRVRERVAGGGQGLYSSSLA